MSDDVAGAEAPIKWTSETARAALRKRYPSNEWALLEEVAPRTGGGSGYSDAVAINLWQSRGHSIHGFEIKVSRGDWLRELKQPAKAESVFAYCNAWWIVAPKGIVKDGELPPTWGLLELGGPGVIRMTVLAPRLSPKPVSLEFFASLMRRGHESLERRAASMVHDQMAESRLEQRRAIDEAVKHRTHELVRMEERVAAFTAATGLNFDGYSGPPIKTIQLAQTIERLGDGYPRKTFGRLETAAVELESTAQRIRAVLNEIGLEELTTPGEAR